MQFWTRTKVIVGLITILVLATSVIGIHFGLDSQAFVLAVVSGIVVFALLSCLGYILNVPTPRQVSRKGSPKDINNCSKPSQERNNSLRDMEEASQRVEDKANHYSQPDVPRHTQIPPEERGRIACKLFTLEELEIATTNFSKDNELGRGGFGVVYKGILRDGQVVAIKRANNKRATNVEQYLNEVSILSQVGDRRVQYGQLNFGEGHASHHAEFYEMIVQRVEQGYGLYVNPLLVSHPNLVKLLGCCLEEEVPLLVYEFISNGNLEEHLQNSLPKYTTKLSWSCRFNIALQIAKALKYLHSEATPPIIHRDIKASNILLDDKFTVKVADFGISKLVDEVGTSMCTVVKGTFGYLDPEYLLESRLTDKSDVYSYGILMLELLTSRKPIDLSLEPGQRNLAVRSMPSINKKRARDIVDPHLTKGFSKQDYDTMQAFAEVAVACSVKESSSRPSMSEVVEMLQKLRGSKVKAESFSNGDAIVDEGPSIVISPILES